MSNRFKKDFAGGVNFLAQLLDFSGVILISLAIFYFYVQEENVFALYLNSTIYFALITLGIFQKFNIYSSWRGRSKFERFRKITSAYLFVATFAVIVSALTKTTIQFSRVWFVAWVLGTLIYLNTYRIIIDLILQYSRRKGWNLKDIIVFGAGELGKSVGEKINEADWLGFNIVAYIDDDKDKIGKSLNGKEIISAEGLAAYIEEKQIREMWIALPFRNEERVRELIHELRHISISIKFIPDIFGFRLLNQEISEIAGIPILQLNGTPIHGLNRIIKEIEDKVISILILLGIWPILIAVAVAIKIESRGPILFKQIRNGWDGKKIKVYKFRSMFVHDEGDKITQAKKNDKRITRVGAFIRRTSLDELPQFINVLQGRMSIVGPRPHVISQNEEYKDQVDFYMQRHRVKPGITGWAQVCGYRGETDTLEKMSKRVEYDLYYIENWSLGFDIKIIFMTIFKGFINKNAY